MPLSATMAEASGSVMSSGEEHITRPNSIPAADSALQLASNLSASAGSLLLASSDSYTVMSYIMGDVTALIDKGRGRERVRVKVRYGRGSTVRDDGTEGMIRKGFPGPLPGARLILSSTS